MDTGRRLGRALGRRTSQVQLQMDFAMGNLVAQRLVETDGGAVAPESHRVKANLQHKKSSSMLCYSGGVSRNLTFTTKVMAGIESDDIRYYAFYKNESCALDGDLRESDRAYFVNGREESVGFTFEWRTSW